MAVPGECSPYSAQLEWTGTLLTPRTAPGSARQGVGVGEESERKGQREEGRKGNMSLSAKGGILTFLGT